ncbi:MAG: hypothetical protein APF84_03545 [Gracilibacter sp. BRH_c7a]|nr:MAG: hypothetical protein APF84_03545 [Gracilibacter sp. BRH_c7a]
MNISKKQLLFYFAITFLFFGLIYPSYSLASTGETAEIQRFSGQNRYQTAVHIAQELNNGPIQSVIISSGLNFPDALSGSVLGVKNNAPILLAGKSLSASQDTMDYVKKNLDKNGTIYLLGGTGVISTEFETKFAELGFHNVVRLGGNDRYESSALIAEQLNVPTGTPVSIVFGGNFPDALGISSFSANKGWPILLSKTNELPDEIKQFIAEKSPSRIFIAGGTGVISEKVRQEIQAAVPNATVERFAGKDRFETSSLINDYFAPNPSQVYLTSGLNYPDALTGSILAGKNADPIVLIDPKNQYIPLSVEKYLKANLNINSFNITALGGTQVVPDHLVSQSLLGVERKPVFLPSSMSSSKGFSIASVPTSTGTLEFTASVSTNTKTVLLVIKKDGKEEIIQANVLNGKVTKNIYPRLGPGYYTISVYESSDPNQSNTDNASKQETFTIYYSGTEGFYDQETINSLVNLDIPTYEEIQTAWLHITKTDGDTRGAIDDYYLPVDGKISHQIFLRYGPGTYQISVYESSNQEGYRPGPSFTVINKDTRDLTYSGRSYWVQSDDPAAIQLAQQITEGISDDLAKSKAIHDWVSTNITYTDQVSANTSFKAMEYAEANSGGYAALTAALHRAVGIQAKVIVGYTIGFGADPGTWEEFDEQTSNYPIKYWNEILINGQWMNVDTLWDSGTLDSEMVFTPLVSDKYFNLSDEEFFKDHRKLVLSEGSKSIPW